MSIRRRPRWLGPLGLIVLALTAALSMPIGGPAPRAFASSTVNGGGSSFAAPEASQWAADVARHPYNLSINYVNSSSGTGRNQYASGNYDYGASDIIYNPEDGSEATTVATQRPFKYVTVSAGGLAFEYNLVINGVKFSNLELTRKDVCQIFTGEIKTWSQLAGTAPTDASLAGVNIPIVGVIRQDSAGESYVLSQYCQAVDLADWNTFKNWVDANLQNINYGGDPNMAAGLPVSYWPGTLYNFDNSVLYPSGAPAAAQDADDPNENGAITYVAAAYAEQLGAPVAAVQNGAGDFTKPNPTSVQFALSYAHANSLGTFNLDFTGSNPAAYFPSTYSYIIDPVTTRTPDPGINGPLNQWLCYSIGQGQNEAAPLSYAPLSAQVTTLSVSAIEATPDAPPANQCGVGGPAPQVVANGGGIHGNNGQSSAGSSGTSNGGGPGASGSAGATGSGSANGAASGTGGSGSNGTGSQTSAAAAAAAAARARVAAAAKKASGAGAAGAGSTTGTSGSTATSSQVLQVAQVASSGSDPIGNQALWWVLGGFVIAAVAAWISGLTRRDQS